MKLRRKALLIIGITFICLIALLYFASIFIIINGFIKIENEDVEKNVNRALDAVSNDITELSTSNRDWAWWDDTYDFIVDNNTDYIETNTHSETWSVLRINLILYLNSSGDMVLGKGYDLKEKMEIPIPESFFKFLDRGNPTFKHPDANTNITGIILLPEGPMMISSMPILTGAGEGPVRGTLIFGRYLDKDELNRLSSITHMSLALYRVDEEKIPDDFRAVFPTLSSNEQIVIKPLSNEFVAGYTVLNDINGDAALILRADLPRVIYNQGRISVMYFLISVISVSLIFGGISIWLIEKQVLSRILRLNNDVTLIKNSKNPSGHVVVDEKDEISSLAISINDTLEGLEHSQVEQRKAQDELKKHRDHLGNLVEERTKELKTINVQLQKQIIERIEAEKELVQSEEKYRTLHESTSDAIMLLDEKGFFDCNNAALQIFGFSNKQDLIKATPAQVSPPYQSDGADSLTESNKNIAQALENGKNSFEWIHRRQNGEDFYTDVLLTAFNFKEKRVLQVNVRDVTQRKKFEHILRENEERFRSVAQSANDAIIITDGNGAIIFWNNGAHKIFGYDNEEVIGKPITFLMPEIYRDAHRNGLKRFLATGESHVIGKTVELSATRKDSTVFPLDLSLSTWNIGEDVFFAGILRDITERKKAEDIIKQHEFHLKDLLDLHRLGDSKEKDVLDFTLEASLRSLQSEFAFIGMIDADESVMTIHKWSNGAMKQCEVKDNTLVFSIAETGILGEAVRQRGPIIVNDYKASQLFKKGYPDGHVPIKRFFSIPIFSGKRIVAIAAVANKVSEYTESDVISFKSFLNEMWGILKYQRTRDEIIKSLEEKEVLLREIHHRVKNNMQIVSSLLNLQSQNIEDKKYKDIFIVSQTRIYAMALIHEKLYQSESLAEINFKEYVNDIVSNISESYGHKRNVKIVINAENIPIKIDYAVPCGLIINELITNSFKYAFPEGRQGIINISAKSIDNNMIRISISDDGIGIAKDVDFRNTKSLGLRLVTGLAESQLHGQIILNREKGTEFQINFRQAK